MNAPAIALSPAELEAWKRQHRCDWCGAEVGEACATQDDEPLFRAHASRGKPKNERARRAAKKAAQKRPPPVAQLVKRLADVVEANKKLRKQLWNFQRRARDDAREAHRLGKELDQLRKQLRALGGAP